MHEMPPVTFDLHVETCHATDNMIKYNSAFVKNPVLGLEAPVIRYVVMRILVIIPTLFLTLMAVFLLGYLGPIDPVTIIQQQQAGQGIFLTPEQLADLRHQYGLDRPFFAQFGTYMDNLLHGNFGYSFTDAAPIWPPSGNHCPSRGRWHWAPSSSWPWSVSPWASSLPGFTTPEQTMLSLVLPYSSGQFPCMFWFL